MTAHTCANCDHACVGYWCQERLYCTFGEGMKEVEHTATCEEWKER